MKRNRKQGRIKRKAIQWNRLREKRINERIGLDGKRIKRKKNYKTKNLRKVDSKESR